MDDDIEILGEALDRLEVAADHADALRHLALGLFFADLRDPGLEDGLAQQVLAAAARRSRCPWGG